MVKQVNKEKLSITLDTEVYKELLKRAEKDDRNVSSMINKTLKDLYSSEKEKN